MGRGHLQVREQQKEDKSNRALTQCWRQQFKVNPTCSGAWTVHPKAIILSLKVLSPPQHQRKQDIGGNCLVCSGFDS